jgi:ABC-type transporter lipoprotein component MlaA
LLDRTLDHKIIGAFVLASNNSTRTWQERQNFNRALRNYLIDRICAWIGSFSPRDLRVIDHYQDGVATIVMTELTHRMSALHLRWIVVAKPGGWRLCNLIIGEMNLAALLRENLNEQLGRNGLRLIQANCIHNFTSNLEEPGIAINDVLQGNLDRAWNTTERFTVNTIVGGVGLFDVATDWDHPHQSADFGQTLGVWGVGPGPCVQIPILGPSNARDTVGKVAGIITDPVSLLSGGAATAVKAASGGLGALDGRAKSIPVTDEVERTSVDYYAALRSIASQKRAAMVEDGKAGGLTEHVYVPPMTTE